MCFVAWWRCHTLSRCTIFCCVESSAKIQASYIYLCSKILKLYHSLLIMNDGFVILKLPDELNTLHSLVDHSCDAMKHSVQMKSWAIFFYNNIKTFFSAELEGNFSADIAGMTEWMNTFWIRNWNLLNIKCILYMQQKCCCIPLNFTWIQHFFVIYTIDPIHLLKCLFSGHFMERWF